MSQSNLPIKGINTDVIEKFQPDGTYRFALNAVLESRDGDRMALCNEEGNSVCANSLPSTKKLIGHTLTDTDDIILFLYDPDPARPEHEIGVLNPHSCVYTTIAKGSCLNFSDKYPINAIFRLKDGCTKYVYFTDNYNPYRVVNISDTSDWVSATKFVTSCNKITYTRPYRVPIISGTNTAPYSYGVSDSGGELKYGTYSFAIRLIDADGNPTDFIDFTRYFPVGYSSQSHNSSTSTFKLYTGASNQEGEIGYKSPSTKSISLSISNLDTEFKYYQLAVIKRTTTSGAIQGVDILTKQEILNPTSSPVVSASFVYTGALSQVDTVSSLEELFSEKLSVQKVGTHTQDNSRLFLGNTTKSRRSYIGYQRHASSIKTEWTKSGVNFPSTDKLSESYQIYSGLKHDEVYAFGIVYIYADGTKSPAFHIPGRPSDIVSAASSGNAYISDANPLDTYTVPGSDVNLVDTAYNKRWQTYNTYTKATPTTGYMGYYESTGSYPTITTTCDTHADGYWGRDFMGNLITPGSKVRHHRTPLPQSQTLPATADYELCGVKFTMADEYPSTDIVGHYYVMADSSLGDKTIEDNGLLFTPKVASTSDYTLGSLKDFVYSSSYVNSSGTKSYFYLSNKTQYDEKVPEASYLRLYYTFNPDTSITENYPTASSIERFGHTIAANSGKNVLQDKKLSNPTQFNFKITSSDLLNRNVKYIDNLAALTWDELSGDSFLPPSEILSFKNVSNSLNLGVLSLDRVIPDAGGTYVVVLKTFTPCFPDLSKIQYKKLTPTYVSKSAGTPLTTNLYTGDSKLSSAEFAETYIWTTGTTTAGSDFHSITAYLESDIVSSFKMNDLSEGSKYKIYTGPFGIVNSSADNLLNHSAEKIYKENDVLLYHIEPHIISRSYSYVNSDNIFYPLEYSYNHCSTCNEEEFPYRIYYSQPDTQESKRDYYRTIFQNNYKDLDGYTNRLVDLVTYKDVMYAITANSIYMVPSRPQMIETNENAAFLGTGEVLSIPPRQLKTTDYAFGGTSHFKSRAHTEYGIVYVDDITGRPFLIGDGLRDLSLDGMRNDWQNNGPLQLRLQFKSKGASYPHIHTTSDLGIGYITTYDPRFKRALIHKRDFKIVPEYLTTFVVATTNTTPNTLWFDGTRFVYNDYFGIQSYPTLDNTYFFENKSFTLSYSFLTASWVSYHSYLPKYLMNNYVDVFMYDSTLRKHRGSYQTFGGIKHDFVIDYISNKSPNNIETFSYAHVRNKSSIDGSFTDKTFDRGVAYTSKQSSGMLNLVPTTPFQSTAANQAEVKKADYSYRVSGFRDNTISNSAPIWDSSHASLASSPFKYIDRIPAASNIDYSQSMFSSQRLKDYFLGLRLYFNPSTNDKLVVDLSDVITSQRNR